MNRVMLRRAQAWACAALFLLAGAARAVDGVIEINQASAMASGFPVVIMTSGSYRLTGNLSAPVGLRAIAVVAPDVVIDLNGFRIEGSGGANVPGIAGSLGGGAGLSVMNGTITGFSGAGIDFGIGGFETKVLRMRI